MAKQRTGVCGYCGARGTITRDHVIPRGFFDPVPGNIPIIPACPTCNNQVKSADDHYVRDILATDMRHANHPVAQINFGKLRRSARAGHSTLAKALPQAQLTELYSPGGLYMGKAYQVPIDLKRLERFMVTLARGLYYHHFGSALPSDTSYTVKFWADPAAAGQLASGIATSGAPNVLVGDGTVFEYLYGQEQGAPQQSYWFFSFYQRSFWSVATRGPNFVVPQPSQAP